MAETQAFEPRIVGFLCNWCSYAGADLAGTSRTAYPPNIRIVRVPCSGRVDPLFVARSLRDGADGVLVLGCHPGDCHYSDGNYYTRRRFAVMHELLVFMGMEPERVRLDWVSASEGARFARVVADFTEAVRRLGPLHVESGSHDRPSQGHRAAASRRGHGADHGRAPRAGRAAPRHKKVEAVLGWERGTVGYRPIFARTPAQASRLELDARAHLNLVTYLRRLAGRKVAVVVRPADMRALNVLLHEGQLKREEVFLIGVGADSGRGPLPASAYDALLGRAPESIDGGLPPSPSWRRWRAGPRPGARPSGTPSSRTASAATPADRPVRSAIARSAWPSSSTRRGSRSPSRRARRPSSTCCAPSTRRAAAPAARPARTPAPRASRSAS